MPYTWCQQGVETIIILENVSPFNLEAIAGCGQAFRWNKTEDGGYTGVVNGRAYKVCQEGSRLCITANDESDGLTFIKTYFDIETDYASIEARLVRDFDLGPAVAFAGGNRILKQDPWETTVSFIISANNSIPHIKRTIENIAAAYGEPVRFEGRTYYSFPPPERLAGLSETELMKTRCGYRARYIIETARMVAEGDVDIYALKGAPSDEALKQLLRLPGVGRKVADCILLYSMQKYDAFPVDVWIKRAMERIYFNGEDTPIPEIRDFAQNKFGQWAGFVQHYLFHYTRCCYGEIKGAAR